MKEEMAIEAQIGQSKQTTTTTTTTIATTMVVQKQKNKPRRRELQVRTASVDKTDLICQLGKPHSVQATVVSYNIPYYYALGTTSELNFEEKHKLQQLLYGSIREQISWCYQEKIGDGVAVAASIEAEGKSNNHKRNHSSSKNSNRILLKQVENEGRNRRQQHQRILLDRARKLDIVSVASGPATYDVGTCPDVDFINEKMESTNATECQIVEGSFQVLAHDVDDLGYLKAMLLDEMEEGMDMEEVWGAWAGDIDRELPNVAFLVYAGDTYEQAFYPPPPPPLIAASKTAGDDVAGTSGTGLLVLIGVGIPIVTALAMLALLVARKRRETMTASRFAMMNSDYVLVGTGDPPGSFHEGMYHYMRDGTRYLSTKCENCLETRRNSFYTDDNLGTILEDREYDEEILVTRANSKDLGGKTSTMDVHRCSSTTCNRCNPSYTNRTMFVPSWKPVPPCSNDSLYVATEHAEV